MEFMSSLIGARTDEQAKLLAEDKIARFIQHQRDLYN